jgi:hypothetical protein
LGDYVASDDHDGASQQSVKLFLRRFVKNEMICYETFTCYVTCHLLRNISVIREGRRPQQDIEPIRTIFPELKAIEVNELMNLGPRFPDAAQTQLLGSVLDDDDNKDVPLCLCVIFLDTVNQLPPPSHRRKFDPASFWKGANGRYIKKRKMGKTNSEKKDDTAITKNETWAKASQKVKQNHRHHFNEAHTNKKNRTMNMKRSIEANTKLNMNMNMQVKMKTTIK